MVTCGAINCGNSSEKKEISEVYGLHKVPSSVENKLLWRVTSRAGARHCHMPGHFAPLISDKKSKGEYMYMHHHLPHPGETQTCFSAKLTTSFGACAVSLYIGIARTNTTNRPDFSNTLNFKE